jgi:hypothetical protein
MTAIDVSRRALQCVAAACEALLAGSVNGVAHEVSVADFRRVGRELRKANLLKNGTGRLGGKGGVCTTDSKTHPGEAGVCTKVSQPRVTWLTPYYDAYRAAYREPPTAIALGRMARALRQLEIEWPRNEVARRFRNYLAVTPPRFYSVEHFASSFAAWTSARPSRQDPLEPLPDESPDAYIARVSRG